MGQFQLFLTWPFDGFSSWKSAGLQVCDWSIWNQINIWLVWRHLLWKYRKENPGTLLGNPPPHGNPGYNSGVLLLHLHRMRMSDLYNSYLEPERLHQLLQKFVNWWNCNFFYQIFSRYSFTGHLGDQDFYTLLSFEQPQLFQTLDCSWNKQLCQWWKDKGYEGIFDQYFKCHQPHIKIWHANCDTQFPQ